MKKILVVFVAGLIFQSAEAQGRGGTIVYERKTNMHKRLPPGSDNMRSMVPEFNTTRQQLIFSGEESIFTTMPDDEDIRDQAGQNGERMNMRLNSGSSEIYKNYAAEKLVELRELGPKKYIIEDTLRKLNWKLREDTVTINGYLCKQATTKNRQGDNILAWYTDAIPVSNGPEQYGGLPGLILKMDVADSWIVYTASDIKLSNSNQLVKIPSGAKKVSRQEFQKMMDEAFGPSGGGPQIRILVR
jgi:GLPGLI family protein